MNELICIAYDNKDVGEFLQWRVSVCSLRIFSPFIRYSATVRPFRLDCNKREEGTSVVEFFGDFSRETN